MPIKVFWAGVNIRLYSLQSLRERLPNFKRFGEELSLQTITVPPKISENVEISAAVSTFQKEKEEKSRFPLIFWLDWE